MCSRKVINIKLLKCYFIFIVYVRNDVTPITMALNGAAPYDQPCAALSSMLSRNALNPADINVLHKHYSSADSPPVSLLRTPQFLGKYIHLYI